MRLAFASGMPHRTWIVCIVGALAAFCQNAAAQSNGSWDVVLNGRSVHMNATHEWNEDNWGLGFEHEFAYEQPAGSRSRSPMASKTAWAIRRTWPAAASSAAFSMRSDDFYVDLGGVAFLMTREEVNAQ